MSDNPYVVVGSPNYASPIVDLFGTNSNKQQGQGQQSQQNQQQGMTFADALKKFLNSPTGQSLFGSNDALASGSAVPGSVGATSVGGANGPSPLMTSSGDGSFMNSQGMGFY